MYRYTEEEIELLRRQRRRAIEAAEAELDRRNIVRSPKTAARLAAADGGTNEGNEEGLA